MKLDGLIRGAERLVRATAETLATVPNVERQLRVVADELNKLTAGEAGSKPKPRRGPAAPTPTVPFTDLDSAKADRALRRLNVRSHDD